jgi:hypothetical protein
MSKEPEIVTKRQHYRLWFEFYKLAKFKGSKEMKANFKTLDGFYDEWQPIKKDTRFDDWWKEKEFLFESDVKEIKSIKKNPNTINVSIPLTMPITKIKSQIEKIVREKQDAYHYARGIKNTAKLKSTAIKADKFKIKGELRGRYHHEVLLVYRFWINEGKPKITDQFINSVEAYFEGRPRSKWRLSALNSDEWNYDLEGYPPEDQNPLKEPKNKTSRNKKNPKEQDYSSEHVYYSWNEATKRSIRRLIEKGDEVCFAVSLGAFPK